MENKKKRFQLKNHEFTIFTKLMLLGLGPVVFLMAILGFNFDKDVVNLEIFPATLFVFLAFYSLAIAYFCWGFTKAFYSPVVRVNKCLNAIINGETLPSLNILQQGEWQKTLESLVKLNDILHKLSENQRKTFLESYNNSHGNLVLNGDSILASDSNNDTLLDHLRKSMDMGQQMLSFIVNIQSIYNNTVSKNSAAEDAMEEITTLAQEVLDNTSSFMESVESMHEDLRTSYSVALQASRAIEETSQRVSSLSNAAAKVNDVLLLIQDVASQTHLLALNATIEAARAGESGKGFAVVASEVKNLANETAKATEDISEKIHEIQLATQDTVHAIEFIQNIIDDMRKNSVDFHTKVDLQKNISDHLHERMNFLNQRTKSISTFCRTDGNEHKHMQEILDKVENTVDRILGSSQAAHSEVKNITLLA